jgi:hypothetical protein
MEETVLPPHFVQSTIPVIFWEDNTIAVVDPTLPMRTNPDGKAAFVICLVIVMEPEFLLPLEIFVSLQIHPTIPNSANNVRLT